MGITFSRFDFVLHANSTIGSYLMRFGGKIDCQSKQAQAAAWLHYKGAPQVDITQDTEFDDSTDYYGPTLNPFNYAPPYGGDEFKPENIPITKLRNIDIPETTCEVGKKKKFRVCLGLLNICFSFSLFILSISTQWIK